MKAVKKLSAFFLLLGLLLLAAAVWTSMNALDRPARLLGKPSGAEVRSEGYMEALCRLDLESLGAMTYGGIRFADETKWENELEKLLWQAYCDVLSFEFAGNCYASDYGLCRDIRVTVLDIPGILEALKEVAQARMEEAALLADPELVYDENDHFRESFALSVLHRIAEEFQESGNTVKIRELTLELTCLEGEWFVLPNAVVLDILGGSMGQ